MSVRITSVLFKESWTITLWRICIMEYMCGHYYTWKRGGISRTSWGTSRNCSNEGSCTHVCVVAWNHSWYWTCSSRMYWVSDESIYITSSSTTPMELANMAMGRLHLDYAGPIEGRIFLDRRPFQMDEVFCTSTSTSKAVIEELKSTYTRIGLPETIVMDNRTCFVSVEFFLVATALSTWHLLYIIQQLMVSISSSI